MPIRAITTPIGAITMPIYAITMDRSARSRWAVFRKIRPRRAMAGPGAPKGDECDRYASCRGRVAQPECERADRHEPWVGEAGAALNARNAAAGGLVVVWWGVVRLGCLFT